MDFYLDFTFGVNAIEGAAVSPEAGKRRFLLGFNGYFQNSGNEHSPRLRSKRSLFFRVVYPVFTGCPQIFRESDATLCGGRSRSVFQVTGVQILSLPIKNQPSSPNNRQSIPMVAISGSMQKSAVLDRKVSFEIFKNLKKSLAAIHFHLVVAKCPLDASEVVADYFGMPVNLVIVT